MKTLSIEFSGKEIRIIELNKKPAITFAELVNCDFDFDDDLSETRNLDSVIYSTAEQINGILKNNNISRTKAGIVINSSQCFLNVSPVDYTDDENNIRSNIIWELSKYFPDTYNNFKINYFRLKRTSLPSEIAYTLIVAMDKKRLEFYKKIFGLCDLKIFYTDVDHFAIEKCISVMYGNSIKNSVYLIAGFKKKRIDISVVNNQGTVYYSHIEFKPNEFKKKQMRLLHLIHDYILDYDASKIFFYGEDTLFEFKKLVSSKIEDTEIMYINPFNFISFPNMLSNNDLVMRNAHKFSAACGLALKSK